MAASTVETTESTDNHHLDHLTSDAVPLVDLRLLSQKELLSLSLSSSASSSLSNCKNDAVISSLKIDPSTFNESAGSRKQTFFRLRLLSPGSQPSLRRRNQLVPQPQALNDDVSNSQLTSLFKTLIGVDCEPTETVKDDEFENDRHSTKGLVDVPIGALHFSGGVKKTEHTASDTSQSAGLKRKRGRPKKNNEIVASNVVETVSCSNELENVNKGSESRETVVRDNVDDRKDDDIGGIVNVNGVKVDLGIVRNGDEFYGNELKKRTEGIGTVSELSVFFEGLEGDWASNRKKRKIVNAGDFGNVLPQGWKLVLCLKHRFDRAWLDCTEYISPDGKHFGSCKEISSYLLTISGVQDSSKSNSGYNDSDVQLSNKKSFVKDPDHGIKDNKKSDSSFPSLASPSIEQENQLSVPSVEKNDADVQTAKCYRCHKCPISFDRQEELMEHLLSAHHRTPKRLKHETSLYEAAIIKEGKYECQFCRKDFAEKKSYYSHLGNHIKDYLKRINNLTKDTSTQTSIVTSAVGASSVTTIHDSVEMAGDSRITSAIRAQDNAPGIKKQRSLDVHSSVPPTDDSIKMERASRMTSAISAQDDARSIEKQRSSDFRSSDPPTNDQKDSRNINGLFMPELCYKGDSLSPLEDRVSNNKANGASSNTVKETKCYSVDRLGGSELTIGLGGDNFPGEINSTNNDQGADHWSFSVSPSWNEHIFLDENNMNGTAKCTVRKPHRKEAEVGSLSSSVGKPFSSSSYNVVKASNGAVNLAKHNDMQQHFKNIEHSDIGLALDSSTSFELCNGSNSFSAFPANGQNFSIKERGECASIREKHTEDRFSQVCLDHSISEGPTANDENNKKRSSPVTMDGHKYEAKRFSNCEQIADVHGPCPAQGADFVSNKMQVDHPWLSSRVSSPNLWTSANGSADLLNSNKEEPTQKHASHFHSGNKQTHCSEDNFDKGLTGTHQEETIFKDLGNFRDSKLMVGCHGQIHRNGVTGPELQWKTNQGSSLLNASGCFPTYDIVSDKGDIFGEKFGAMSSFEGLRSESVDNMEYNFLASKVSTRSERSKGFPYDAEIAQEFDTPFWLEKEDLPSLPDKPSIPCAPITCAWCKNELRNLSLAPTTETGVQGSICADCKAKFNRQLKFL